MNTAPCTSKIIGLPRTYTLQNAGSRTGGEKRCNAWARANLGGTHVSGQGLLGRHQPLHPVILRD